MSVTAGLVTLTTVALGAMLAEREEFDPNTVTPGVIGFVATFGLAVIVVLLAFDMVRRVRRTRYRAQIGEQLDAEEAEARAISRAEVEGDTGAPTDSTGTDEPGPNDRR